MNPDVQSNIFCIWSIFIWTKICFLERNNDAHVGVLQTKKFPSRVRAALTNCFVHSAAAVLMAVQHTVFEL